MGHEARRNALAAAAGAVALVTAAPVGAVSTAASAPAATPKTLVSVRGSIGGFAQDGNRVVWLWSGGRRCRDFVQLRNLRTRKQVPLAAKRGATCPPADGFIAGSLALAKDRALWAVYSATGGNTVINYAVYVVSGQPGARDRVVYGFGEEIEKDDSGDAPNPEVGMAGDGPTLAFAVDGVVRRVVRGRTTRAAPFLTTAFATAAGKIGVARQTSPGGCVCNQSPRWSPDGARLAFSGGQDNSARPSVYTATASGGAPSRIVDGFQPLWSPDGSKLVREQYTLSNSFDSIVIVTRDGGNPHRIDDAADASWSPDGTKLAVTRPRPSTEDVVVVNADGTGERVLAANARGPDWSPDGTKLAFVGRSGIEVIGADGSNRHTVTARFSPPKWSPEGSKLLFADGNGLHLISADGTGDVQVTHPDTAGGENDATPTWSPSGSEIAFVRSRFDYTNDLGEQEQRIWIVNADGTGLRPLTARSQFEDEPAWSPTGVQIAFASGGELYVASADGTGLTQITTTQPAEARSEGAVFSAASKK